MIPKMHGHDAKRTLDRMLIASTLSACRQSTKKQRSVSACYAMGQHYEE